MTNGLLFFTGENSYV